MRVHRVVVSGAGCALLASAGAAQTPSFTNVTNDAGVATTFIGSGYANEEYTGGGAVGDFNNDGWQDLIVLKGDGRDRLFMNNQDGTFTDVGEAAGMISHRGKGAVTGDYDDDGWLDIFVTSAGPVPGVVGPGNHILYHNNGDGTFTNLAVEAGVNKTANVQDGFSGAFGDYDLDGDLDLFVAGFAAGNAGSRIFRNNGDGTFTDMTAAINFFGGTPQMFAFTPRFVDMDGDVYPDMPLIADFGTSRYFRNDTDGTFTDITFAAGLGKEENGMGGNIGDFNNDGMIDLYASSIYFPDINWTGNKLYVNQGDHEFTEISNSAGVYDGGYGWGCVCVDFNHDGWQDIAETNGGNGTFDNEQSYLFMNNGDNTFDEMAVQVGLSHFGQGRGFVNFDYDNDGDQDVVIFANDGPIAMYRSNLVNGDSDRNWFRLFLDTSEVPELAPHGWGARVYVTATIGGEEMQQFRYMSWGSNFESSSELSVHFGLGDATTISELRIEWTNADETVLNDLAANQTMTISAGGCPGDFNGDGAKNILDFVAFQTAFVGNDDSADCDGNGTLNILDFVCFQSVFAEPCP
jgi:hypothetical protein